MKWTDSLVRKDIFFKDLKVGEVLKQVKFSILKLVTIPHLTLSIIEETFSILQWKFFVVTVKLFSIKEA